MRLFPTILFCALIFGVPANAAKTSPSKRAQLIIYYDNDVHCHVDGYPVVAAAAKAQAHKARSKVLLVSSGDFVQGASLGASTRGGCIVEMMNAAGYDFVTLGNHEFDYGMPRLLELTSALDAKVLDCNLQDLRTGSPETMFAPWSIVDCGRFSVALIGVSTPYSFVTSTPSYFQDDNGNFVYSLSADNFYDVFQRSIDEARGAGADFVVVLSHLGDDLAADPINSHELIANTSGIDVVLDGHAHHEIECETYPDRSGREVVLTSTGSYFENVGRLEISRRGKLSTSIIPLEKLERKVGRDARTQEAVDRAKAEYQARGSRVVCHAEAALPSADEDSPRIARSRESGLGDFCADALRITLGTDVAIIGGGAIRAGLPAGEVTFNDIYTLFPFGNTVARARLSGAQIADLLEYSVMALPVDFGGFMQVSGLRFKVDVQTPTPVLLDVNRAFAGFADNAGSSSAEAVPQRLNEEDGSMVAGSSSAEAVPQRRVREIEVLGPDGSYAPVDPSRIYTVAGSAYTLAEGGDGYRLLCGDDVTDTGIIDLDLLEDFIANHLGGTIPARYSLPEGRIEVIY